MFNIGNVIKASIVAIPILYFGNKLIDRAAKELDKRRMR